MKNLISNSKVRSKNYSSGRKFKQRVWAFIVMLALAFTLIPAVPALADTDSINYSDQYQWTGNGTWGTSISGSNTGTMKFQMTDSYLAFCVDISTTIKQNRNYVKVPIDHDDSTAMFSNNNADPNKIRAILTYAWDKTDPDEIAAIQYALWNEMHGTNLPTNANQSIKTIFDNLVDDTETPPIDATGINPNNFVLTGPSPDSQQYIFTPETTEYSFDFIAESGANIVFSVFDENENEMANSEYEVTDNGSGSYTLKLKNVSGPSNYSLEATTLKDTAVDAYVFMSLEDDSNQINVKKSQTVAGIKLSNTTQTESFDINLYYAATGSLDLSGRKTLNGRDLTEGEFTFELYKGEEASGEPYRTATNDGEGNFSFETINYTLNDVGTNTYTVKEHTGELGGITYDMNTYTVTVTITDNENGTLSVVSVLSGDTNGISFTNDYEATGSLDLSGRKTLNGRDLTEGEFTFELYEGEEASGEPFRTATNDGEGNFSFDIIEYTLEDADDTKTYTVVEQAGDLGGMTYDTNTYTIIVNISDNGLGDMVVSFDEASDDPDEIIFTNDYEATGNLDLAGSKTLTGRDLTEGEFTFELYEGEEASGEPFRTATNDGEGNFSFDTIEYTLEDADDTKTYTVVEQAGNIDGIIYDTNTYTLIVNISDNGDGTMSVTFTEDSDDPEELNFTNSVTVIIIEEDETPLVEPTPTPEIKPTELPQLPTITPEIVIPLAPADPTLPTIEVVTEELPKAGENAPLWPIGLALLIIAGGVAYLMNRKQNNETE